MNTDDQLAQIEKIAQNARTTWFGLLALLVFVGVTLMGHKDADFFAYGAATQLPLVGIEVPPTAFFVAAPILTAAVFCYMHVYLLGLWEALGRIEQPSPAQKNALSDQIFPILFTNAALWYRNRLRGDGSFRERALGRWTLAIALAMGWGFGWLILGLLWWRSMALHSEGLTLLIGLSFWLALFFGAHGLWAAHAYLRNPDYQHIRQFSLREFTLVTVLLALLSAIGWLRTEGGVEAFIADPWITTERTGRIIPLAQARLGEAELTRKPAEWLDFEDWTKEYTLTFRRRYDLGPEPGDWPEHRRAELAEEIPERWTSLTDALDRVTLQDADLRHAVVLHGFLAGADLRRARLDRASLQGVRMEGADLRLANAPRAYFGDARLQGAFLNFGEFGEAYFAGARLDNAQLYSAGLVQANFNGASLVGADLAGARLISGAFSGTDLREAEMPNAVMSDIWAPGIRMARADLRDTDLARAYLGSADLQGADMLRANLAGADLEGATLRGANCTNASFHFAGLHGTDLRCKPGTLRQRQLNYASGDWQTVLPEGLHVWSCIDRNRPRTPDPMPDFDEISQRPEDAPARRKSWHLCEPGDHAFRIDYDPFERRFWRDTEDID